MGKLSIRDLKQEVEALNFFSLISFMSWIVNIFLNSICFIYFKVDLELYNIILIALCSIMITIALIFIVTLLIPIIKCMIRYIVEWAGVK